MYFVIAFRGSGPPRLVRVGVVFGRRRGGTGGFFGSGRSGRGARVRLRGGWWARASFMAPIWDRDEDVVMAVIAPVEVGSSWAVPDFNRVVVRPVDGDRVGVAAREHVGVLLVAPFPVRAKCMAEVVGVGPTEGIVWVEVVEKGREVPQKVSLNGTVVVPV